MSRDYLDVEYSLDFKPKTDYPSLLAAELAARWNLRQGDSLLDVACGRAEMSAGFVSLGLNVTAVDASPEARKYASEAGAKFIAHLVEPKTTIPVPSESFDVVFCKSFVEHLREPIPFATDCYRILKPGGTCLFLTPDWEANQKIFFDDVTHVTPFSRTTMRQVLELSGFDCVASYRFRQLPSTWRNPAVNVLAASMAPFVRSRSKRKFLRWSRELLLCGIGQKPR
jgi:2-polyprenyl-3-methyl-5-hydroxy-6-metoxy-1,4-benzoquinol methylase